MTPDISAIVPTRNRPKSLYRLLQSLENQTYKVSEVIIIDSSDIPLDPQKVAFDFPGLNILYRTSDPSVCAQRNLAVSLSSSGHLLLCSDDLEIPPGYTAGLVNFIRENPEQNAVTGFCREPDDRGEFQSHFPVIRLRTLLWKFIFQLSVWADVERTVAPFIARPALLFLQKFYRRRGNRYSLGGWPLMTQISETPFRTSLFGLDGLLVKKEWIVRSPYDESLSAHGIGENYGITMNFPGDMPITVVPGMHVLHHKEQENRLPSHWSYLLRILALDYFMSQSPRFVAFNRIVLVWSLVGNLIYQLFKRQQPMRKSTVKALRLLLTRKNPYVHGEHLQGIESDPTGAYP